MPAIDRTTKGFCGGGFATPAPPPIAHYQNRFDITRFESGGLADDGVPAVDHEVALGLLQIAHAARLLGTQVVLAGIRPEVAQSIVGLGMDLAGLHTTATFEDGIAMAAKSARQPTSEQRQAH